MGKQNRNQKTERDLQPQPRESMNQQAFLKSINPLIPECDHAVPGGSLTAQCLALSRDRAAPASQDTHFMSEGRSTKI